MHNHVNEFTLSILFTYIHIRKQFDFSCYKKCMEYVHVHVFEHVLHNAQ